MRHVPWTTRNGGVFLLAAPDQVPDACQAPSNFGRDGALPAGILSADAMNLCATCTAPSPAQTASKSTAQPKEPRVLFTRRRGGLASNSGSDGTTGDVGADTSPSAAGN